MLGRRYMGRRFAGYSSAIKIARRLRNGHVTKPTAFESTLPSRSSYFQMVGLPVPAGGARALWPQSAGGSQSPWT